MAEAGITGQEAPAGFAFEHCVLDPAAVPSLARAEAVCRDQVREYVARRTGPVPVARAVAECDAAALADRVDDPAAWSDISIRPELSDLIAMNGDRLAGDEAEAEITASQQAVAAAVEQELVRRGWNPAGAPWSLSGHLWYPAASVLGWHTNVRVPGWRAYLSWVAEPGRSFFRYRDPTDGRIVTSWDEGLDLRVFPITVAEPLWHCVWAGRERHSFGYRLAPVGR